MTKLIDMVHEVQEAHRQEVRARETADRIAEQAFRAAILDEETVRARAIIATIPGLVRNALNEKQTRVVVMEGIPQDDVDVKYLRRGKQELVTSSDCVRLVREYLDEQGLGSLIVAEQPISKSDELRSKNDLYKLVAFWSSTD